MSKKNLIIAVLLALLVAACAAPTEPVDTQVATQPPAATEYPGPQPPAATEYPGPQQPVTQPTSRYPGPSTGEEVETQEAIQVTESEYQPAPGDDKLKRSTVHLDLESSEIVIMESFPVQVNVILRGALPDPCHELRIVPSEPNEDKEINIEVYTLADPSQACITVIEPFKATVSLGSIPTGSYIVLVNGEVLGKFDA